MYENNCATSTEGATLNSDAKRGTVPPATALADEIVDEKMRPHYFEECCPITSLDSISQVIDNPPDWIERIAPLRSRSTTVIQNFISDCHTESDKIIPNVRLDKRFMPKTLVCHDYKGGYLEDRHFNETSTGNQYTFYNWAHIDIFVYFSHHLITIPPLCWINAAHRNGVKILGTFITEFSEGTKICETIFKDVDTMRIFATSLAQISKLFKFDGWLLNIENALTASTMVLKQFVSYLTTIVHEDNTGKLVLWYDSITTTGELRWQNELNVFNQYFFDNCDGIFLNYVWTEERIRSSVRAAKHRNLDVYVGIDVFGRNTFAGGQYNCYKAAQIIRRYKLSMAIFAPGWTHETLPKTGNRDQFFRDFINRDSAFWNSLWPFLYTHPIKHFFTTNFYIGVDQTVYNMFNQQQQLSKIKHPTDTIRLYSDIMTLANKCKCLKCDFKDGEMKCLISTETLNPTISYIHRLFSCDIELDGDISVFFITENASQHPVKMNFILLMSDGNNDRFKEIQLNGENVANLTNNATTIEINPSDDVELISGIERSYNSLIFENSTSVFAYEFSVNGTLLEVGCKFDEGKSIYLRAFGIKKTNNTIYF